MPAPRTLEKSLMARSPRFPSSHSLKARVMESLDHGEPLTTKALSEKLRLHQSSVSHTLKELMEEDLVTKKGKGYRLSNLGFIQKNTMDCLGKTLRCLKDQRDFFLSHDLSGIPKVFQVTMGVVCETREIVENDPAMPNHIQEIIVPLLAQSRNFQVASSILIPEHQLTVAQAVKEEGSLQAITSDRILQELRLKSIALRDGSLHSRIELYRHNNINFHLIVTESHLFLSLPRTDGTSDLHNIIINKDPEAVEWGRMLFLYFKSRSEKVDLVTF